MHLDTQTTIFMICFVYFILHGAIWLALQEYRSQQVRLWCAAGMFSGMAVVLLAMRGQISEFVFFYVAQLLMLIGNWGRMVALRMYLYPEPQERIFTLYKWVNLLYFLVFVYLIHFEQAEWEALILFNAFYALLCFDYFRIGQRLYQLQASLGAKLLIWGGLTLSSTLAVRTFGVFMSGTIDDIYEPSWHQAVMVIGQFIAITLCNIAFLRIFLEIAERKKMVVAKELILTTERADAMQRTSLSLKSLLDEREEIIRQLTLYNKTAGMGALVASLAHELNQPLTVIQLNADMIELVLNDRNAKSRPDASIETAMLGLRKANRRAATIISTLRTMFAQGSRSTAVFDFNELVNELVSLSQSTLQLQSIDLQLRLHPQRLMITGDKSQLQQVLINLLANASDSFLSADLKNSRAITVQTDCTHDQVFLRVTDNGCGISSEVQPMVFELLRTSKQNGMGIGLWLSKTIIDAHKGSIGYTTELGRGTQFTVSLPLTTEPMVF